MSSGTSSADEIVCVWIKPAPRSPRSIRADRSERLAAREDRVLPCAARTARRRWRVERSGRSPTAMSGCRSPHRSLRGRPVAPRRRRSATRIFAAAPRVSTSPDRSSDHVALRPQQHPDEALAVPSGVPFTIRFDNKDIGPHGNHDVRIFEGGGSSFVGDIAPDGTSMTYEVPAFEAGTYQFRCDAHPAMNGAFIVK